MDNILEHLNQAVGIVGSMVLTKGGEYVCGHTGNAIDQTAGSALAADIIKGCRGNLESIAKSDFTQCIIESTKGKIVIYDAGAAYLFVIADHRLRLNMTILDIQSAAGKIRRELN